jgi:LmbE family N-acetylglucosaminyl deacetylase
MPGLTHSGGGPPENTSPASPSAATKGRRTEPFYKVDYAMSGYNPFTISSDVVFDRDLVIERPQSGKPHRGKVFAAVQAHADDVPLYCAGLMAKLVREGYTGHIIRMTNDDMSGVGSVGNGMVEIETQTPAIAKALGIDKSIDLNFSKHRLETVAIQELKMRLVFLFRALKVDTVITFDPYNTYEENPDHWMTAYAVMPACWHAGGGKEYPEFGKAGIEGHAVSEKYYYPRSPQGHNVVNRVVDISDVIDEKVNANLANLNFGPAGNSGSRLRQRLAEEGRRLPLLGNTDSEADFNYIKELLMEDWRALGKEFGLEYAEAYHYIGPSYNGYSSIQDYVDKHAVALT